MILDTTYFLPLIGIDVDENLLLAIDEGRAGIDYSDIELSLITIFELQAKASKLGINSEEVVRGINAILRSFKVIPFYEPEIVKIASQLRKLLKDYIDCIVVATAIIHGKELVTEDTDILAIKDKLRKEYNLRIYNYRNLMKK